MFRFIKKITKSLDRLGDMNDVFTDKPSMEQARGTGGWSQQPPLVIGKIPHKDR